MFGKWEEGCKCVRNPCKWGRSILQITHHEANPISIHKQGPMVLLVSHPTRLIPKWKGGGGWGAMHAFHGLCLVYMNKFHVPFPSFRKYPFPCMEGVRGEVHNIIFSLAVTDRLLVQMYTQFLGYHYSLSWPITNQNQRLDGEREIYIYI